jgi:hypothetical protein
MSTIEIGSPGRIVRATRRRERGSALLVTLILVGALLAGSAVLVLMQMTSNRSTDLTRNGLASLYCAEAGLAAARPTVLSSVNQWNATLAAEVGDNYTAEKPLFAGVNHLLSGDLGPAPDYVLHMKDNDDETPPANDPTVDSDLRVFVVSTCLKYPDNPKQVEELIQFTGGGTCYNSQLGGCGTNGNGNGP